MSTVEADDSLPGPRDPGLQGERTALAWSRTAFAVLANSLLVLRSGLSSDRIAITALAIALLVAAAMLFAFADNTACENSGCTKLYVPAPPQH